MRRTIVLLICGLPLLGMSMCHTTTTTPVTPAATTMTVHVQVNDAYSGAGIAGATAKIQTAASTWLSLTTDSVGHGYWSNVPVGLTDTQIEITAPAGWVSASTHHVVSADYTATFALDKAFPASATWPAFRCDLDGVPVASIATYGQTDSVFSIILPVYPEAVQRDVLTAHGRYSHFVLDPRPKYPPYYPSGDFSTPELFRPVLRRVVNAGFIPVVFFDAEITSSMSAAEALALFRATNDPILTDASTMALIKIAVPGWEANDHMTPSAFDAVARYLRSKLDADALEFVHMTPYHAAICEGDGCEASWWKTMADDNVLDGILYQHQITDTVANFTSRLADFTDRLVYGKNGWPTTTGRGTPLYVEAFEYDAYWRTRGQTTEAAGKAWGDAALGVAGVSGYCDGGTK